MKGRGKLVAVCVVWLVILGLGAMAWKWFVVPSREAAQKQAEAENKKKILTETGSDSRYDHVVNVALDSFSGYAVLRSEEFANELGSKRIKFNLVDDGADYTARMKALKDGEIQLAVITIDALIKGCDTLGTMPATIVAVVDETRGADAMVAFKSAVPNVDAFNHKDMKFILTPNSPSETLTRVVQAHFNLTGLGPKPFVDCKDAEEVYKKYRAAKHEDKQVFVLWEPYVSKVLENPNMHVVVDSSRFKGYIVDVIVANRDFLHANRDVVTKFIESYFRANYAHRDKMVELILADVQKTGSPITDNQAKSLVNGIWWKNTQENYVHFGVEKGKLQHVEDAISNITKVLLKTGTISKDPTNGQPNLLYYPQILQQMQAVGFHPGVEKVRDDTTTLPVLTQNQWKNLQPVGTLELPPLVFARGTATMTEQSQRVLDDLVKTFNTWPQYYLVIKGNASLEGDVDVNKALATTRARAAEQYLVERGISQNRINATGEATGKTSVDFILGQLPY